jgi:signal transduction histidine kinase
MAHEINNPLTVIGGYIQMLVRELSDPVWRQRSNAVLGAVETIRESVDRLNRLAELKLADQSRAEERWSR